MQVTVNTSTFPLISTRAATETLNGFRRDVFGIAIRLPNLERRLHEFYASVN